MYVCIHRYISLSIYLSISLYIYNLSLSIYICTYTSVCTCLRPPAGACGQNGATPYYYSIMSIGIFRAPLLGAPSLLASRSLCLMPYLALIYMNILPNKAK